MTTVPALPRRDYSRSPGLLPMLKTVVYVISLSLGVGSVFAAIWSKYLLPLLYSSFSARKAVTERQLVGMTTLVEGLRTIRKSSLYQQEISGVKATSDESKTTIHSESSETTPALSPPIHPTPTSMYRLPTLLTTLSTQMSATETTQSSLIATLESFTSYLHTQSFLFARGGRGGQSGGVGGYYGSIGMNALGDNLRKAGAMVGTAGADTNGEEEGKSDGEKNLIDIGVKMQDWEEAKREVRAMKGILLSRRSLTGPAASPHGQ